MLFTLSLVVVTVLLLMACGVVVWLLRQRHQHRLALARRSVAPSAWASSSLSAGTQPAWRHTDSPRPSRPPEPHEEDTGPDTVVPYADVPEAVARPEASASARPSQHGDDFGASTLPQPLADAQTGAWSHANPEDLLRIQSALQALGDGPVDQAWDKLRGFFPEAAHREAALETFERIALAFERSSRYDSARDVYEHMADIDPQWRQVKVRLMRARGLAQSATANNWGTGPARPVPSATQRQLGKYVVERQIGKGAMGAVYLGYDPATDRQVALKTMALSQEFSGTDLVEARLRFLREAEMAGRLKHPDIVSIIDAGEVSGLAYIAMELIEGVDLSHHVHPAKLLPLSQLLPIVARVAEALAYAHSRGVTHRDIKPANIMVDLNRGGVKVMDFGVARVADAARTRTGVVLGTPTFMSPEQLSGQSIDGRSDLYSLGVTLFQLLTGELPYRNDSMAALMRAIGQQEAPNVCAIRPDLPPALGDIVALALEKHPSTRYGNGHQMAEDLRAVAMTLQQLDIELG